MESTTSSPTRHRSQRYDDPPLPSSLTSPLTNQQERDEIERIVSNMSMSSARPIAPHNLDRHSRPHYNTNPSSSSDDIPDLLRREGYSHSPTPHSGSVQNNGVRQSPPSSPGFMRRSSLGDSFNTGWSTSSSLFDRGSHATMRSPPRAQQQPYRMSVTATPPAPPSYVSQYSQLDGGKNLLSGVLGASSRSSHCNGSTASARLSGSTAVVAAMKALQHKIGMLESERDSVLQRCSALEASLNETQREGDRRAQVRLDQ
jgi:hypothetical protein